MGGRERRIDHRHATARGAIWRALTLGALAVTAGCRGCSEQATPAPPRSSAIFLTTSASAYVQSDLAATSAEEAMSAIDARVAALACEATPRPNVVSALAECADLLVERGGVKGAAEDLEFAVDLSSVAIADAPRDANARLARMRALRAARRLTAALSEWDAAVADDPDAAAAHAAEHARLLVDLGRYDEALASAREAAARAPSLETLHAVALAAYRTAKIDEAESSFVAAESRFDGGSPLPLADLYFDRASMWESEGDLAKATSLYRAAHERAPMHVHAAIHLAALVPPSDAVKLLEPLARESRDPELMAALGLYRGFVKDGSGDADVAHAKARFDELAGALPEAYAERAGWFWLSVGGDPAKALASARRDLDVAETPEAIELALRAAQAAGDKAALCAFASKGRALAYPSKRLAEELRLVADCGP
jgi:tetratricopeptide (TPR) repeat protein